MMNDPRIVYLRAELFRRFAEALRARQPIPAGGIEEVVDGSPFPFSEIERHQIIRKFESTFEVSQGMGTAVLADHRPWLAKRAPNTEFYYWNRLQSYYLDGGNLHPAVVSTLDQVTDEILDYCGDPRAEGHWRRRGMVIGHVQSGKTTNYSALITKAADTEYKIIILLAGMTNSLRAQTQERIDETFIGKKSLFQAAFEETLSLADFGDGPKRFPAYGTSRDRDFKKENSDYGVTISALKEPIIFVMKKNVSTLENLSAWLDSQMHGAKINHPLLLIDDEADNASINTTKDAGKVTAINGAIRGILQKFNRSTYIGYTATPFANIFIDPSTESEMFGDDLFPEHFIKALDAPTNYVGAHRVFGDGDLAETMVRVVDDYQDALPLKHKNGDPLTALPETLLKAIRVFFLARAIRVLRGDGKKHCSMMINVSRFNAMQEQVLGLVYAYSERLKKAIRVNAGLGKRALDDPDIAALAETFGEEYPSLECNFDDVLKVFTDASRPIETRTVNMKGGALDYSANKDTGLHIIAIGGLALSRGLTLEGLCVSYILRNTAASDTLMQMARWFGYRPEFEDLCRLYLPRQSLEHYDYIADAIEELRSEVKRMRARNETPKQFGLKVRRSETGIAVTAGNKMRASEKREFAADLSGKHIEGHTLKDDAATNKRHLDTVVNFIEELGHPIDATEDPDPEIAGQRAKHLTWKGVSGRAVTELLEAFDFPIKQTVLGQIEGRRSLAIDYLSDRIDGELKEWDVVVPLLDAQRLSRPENPRYALCGEDRAIRTRPYPTDSERDLTLYRPYGLRNRIADPKDASLLLTKEQVSAAETAKGENTHLKGDRAFCLERDRPLLLIHLFRAGVERGPGEHADGTLRGEVSVSLSFCLPGTQKTVQAKTYHVNKVWLKSMAEDLDEARDDDEEALSGGNDD
ncbi:MAG: Z1 domain-containing protein [Maricaulis sp.]|uniref:Z1 domain-containing protein n=1 Tax=Maricaulis sp. TaxID=1486257 RepID=UPI001B2C5212|nr:Z1 domain-containing protein [Maricaulis sp.]MBO6878298.1 Z1 domain-containing protein [Maricaulis sp.]